MKHLLVAVDQSECANRALQFALSLAKAEGLKLSVCSVADPSPVYGTIEPVTIVEKTLEEIDRSAHHAVDAAVARASAAGVEAGAEVLEGDPAREIVLHAGKIGADAIVLGTHGRTGLRRLLMGSVAEGVLRKAEVPVITVRDAARIEDPTPEAVC